MEEVIKLTEEAIAKELWTLNYHENKANEASERMLKLKLELTELKEKFGIAEPEIVNPEILLA